MMEATCTSLAWHAQSAAYPRDILNGTFINLRLYVVVQIALNSCTLASLACGQLLPALAQ